MRTTERAPERTTTLFGGPPRCLLLGTPFMDRVLPPERGPRGDVAPLMVGAELLRILLPRTAVNNYAFASIVGARIAWGGFIKSWRTTAASNAIPTTDGCRRRQGVRHSAYHRS